MAARKDSSEVLGVLRELMKKPKYGGGHQLDGYVIPTGDAHLSMCVANCDKRIQFVSGFTGYVGTAVLTLQKAALWTDGYFYLQAERELDDHWILMKEGFPGTPKIEEWLTKELSPGSSVGADPSYFDHRHWKMMKERLTRDGVTLVALEENLVHSVWDSRPPQPCEPLYSLPINFAGKPWQEKVQEVRGQMETKGAMALVVTILDECAWLLNIRGNDILYVPCGFCYIIVTEDSLVLFVDDRKLTPEVREHLQLEGNKESPTKITTRPYESFTDYLKDFITNNSGKIWISDLSSYAFTSLVPEKRRISSHSPITTMKILKNETEKQGMRNANLRDSVAFCEFLHWLEKEIGNQKITERSAERKLVEIRSQQADYVEPSFETVTAVGANAAMVLYCATDTTDKALNREEVYLCDAGGHFKDGTTDVTRTVHFGTPDPLVKECFTRVLQGHIHLCQAVFPNGVTGHRLDSIAKEPLWRAGLDYPHLTSHGVGCFLHVVEGPYNIGCHTDPHEVPLEEGMTLSNEPGVYIEGKFGVRIECMMMIRKADTKYNFKDKGFLEFEILSWIPIQTKMIDFDLLDREEVDWLNWYHTRCREVLEPVLKEQDKHDVLAWLVKETEPVQPVYK